MAATGFEAMIRLADTWNIASVAVDREFPRARRSGSRPLLQMVQEGWSIERPSPWLEIPYQLLTAACGTVLQARLDESEFAVLVVHVFETAGTTRQRLEANSAAFARFVKVFTGILPDSGSPGQVHEPKAVAGMALYAGKTIARV